MHGESEGGLLIVKADVPPPTQKKKLPGIQHAAACGRCWGSPVPHIPLFTFPHHRLSNTYTSSYHTCSTLHHSCKTPPISIILRYRSASKKQSPLLSSPSTKVCLYFLLPEEKCFSLLWCLCYCPDWSQIEGFEEPHSCRESFISQRVLWG